MSEQFSMKSGKGAKDATLQGTASDAKDATKTKAQLRAERRALQEAQRAAKAASKGQTENETGGKLSTKNKSSSVKKGPLETGPKKQTGNVPRKLEGCSKEPPRVSEHILQDVEKSVKRQARKLEKQNIPQRTSAQKKVGLFRHLHQYEKEVSLTREISFSPVTVHGATLKLGLQFAEGFISGSNARCAALLALMKQIIQDYVLAPDKEISRDLVSHLEPNITFLQQCRQRSVSMANAIKHIKGHITNIPRDMPQPQAKERLLKEIDDFYHDRIIEAGRLISEHAQSKIVAGDVILVFSCSSLIQRVLLDAHKRKTEFSVIVIDSRPKFEGREMVKRLVKHGIRCHYGLINAVSYAMSEVTKVFLGAHALLANGYVMSRIGSSQVAVVARAYNVPVLVCCETYKFSERVQTDSFVFNELGDPDVMVGTGRSLAPLSDWRDKASLRLLHLLYDVTPSDQVNTVITELGYLPCTSVPVVLRVWQERKESQQQHNLSFHQD